MISVGAGFACGAGLSRVSAWVGAGAEAAGAGAATAGAVTAVSTTDFPLSPWAVAGVAVGEAGAAGCARARFRVRAINRHAFRMVDSRILKMAAAVKGTGFGFGTKIVIWAV